MKLKNNILIIALLLLLMSSCKKDEQQEFTDTPILEAYIETGNYLMVKVSRQIPFATGVTYSSDDINNLLLTFTRNDSSFLLTPADSGRYVDSTIQINDGDNIKLAFTFNSKSVSAYSYIPSKPQNFTQSATSISIEKQDSTSGPPSGTMPDPVKLEWDNSDGSYYLVVVENLETTLVPIRDFGGSAPPGNRFRKSPTNLDAEEINAREFQYFGTHRIILFHVLPDYAALYNQSGTNSQNLTNPSTSITNGYGIFTGMNSDTLYIQVNEL